MGLYLNYLCILVAFSSFTWGNASCKIGIKSNQVTERGKFLDYVSRKEICHFDMKTGLSWAQCNAVMFTMSQWSLHT